MKKVLIVDDLQENRYLLQELLKGHGFEVTEAVNGADALDRARSNPPDLVVSDLLMPVMDGYALLRRWKADERLCRIPFVVYTGTYTDTQDERLALDLGADGFIVKPVDPVEFLDRINKVLDAARNAEIAPRVQIEITETEILRQYNDLLIRKLESKRLELEAVNRDLVERESRFRRLADNAVDLIYRYDFFPKRGFSYVSPVSTSMTGYTPEDHYADPDLGSKLVHPDDRLLLEQASAETNASTSPLVLRWKRRDGTIIWTEHRNVVVHDDQGRVVAVEGIARDVSARLALEEQLLQSRKMEAVGRLAGGVAHDFNNILAAILMQTEISLLNSELPESVRVRVEEVRASAERAADLTKRLLLFSRKQVRRPESVDVNVLVQDLVVMLRRIIGEDVSLELRLHGEPLVTWADPSMLSQVLMNLVINGRDAMPSGGTLVIETRKSELDVYRARFLEVEAGPFATVVVQDTGVGIPADVLPHIFEPFFTTKEIGQGTGLGLSTVFAIVQQHHGAVEVDSTPGKGTLIRVHLPAAAHEAVDVQEAHAPPSIVSGGSETILVVEDDPDVRRLTRTILEQAGYRVFDADRAESAFKAWDAAEGSINLLFTDMVLPGGVGGREISARLCQADPRLRVVITSGYSPETAGQDLTLAPGHAYLAKPARMADLLQTVRRCLDE